MAMINIPAQKTGDRPGSEGDAEFKAALIEVIPHLRAFGRSLSRSAEAADDLVQETLLKAWLARDRFVPNSNLRAWTFTILRNVFLSERRRDRFSGDWNDEIAGRVLYSSAAQDHNLHLQDLQRALTALSDGQREALILICVGGFSYDEAAEICGCAIGTIKSRVARARLCLEEIFAFGAVPLRDDAIRPDGDVFGKLMCEVAERVRNPHVATALTGRYY